MLGARGIASEYLAENLRQIGDAARAIFSAAESAYVDGLIDAANNDHGHLETTEGSDPTHGLPALAVTRSLFTQAILLGQRKAAETVVMQAIENGVPLLDVYVDVLQEAMFALVTRVSRHRTDSWSPGLWRDCRRGCGHCQNTVRRLPAYLARHFPDHWTRCK
jgi:hypothetical protein